jgi:hypothetical protein
MSCSPEEFEWIRAKFPAYRDRDEGQAAALYEDFLGCERDLLAEPMDYFKYLFDELDDASRRQFVTRRQYEELCRAYDPAPARGLIENKHRFIEAYGRFLCRDACCADDGLDETEDFIDAHRQVVVKPTNSGYGKGIRLMGASEAYAEAVELVANHVILEELMVQHPVLASFHPSSVNCVRILTVIDDAGEAHLAAAALRTGEKGSFTDSGGGLAAGVDVATGTVVTDAVTHFGERYACHPDTGVRFEGTVLPAWDDLLGRAREVALSSSGLRLMNWDWACLADGRWALVEGNLDGGIGPCQQPAQQGLAPTLSELLDTRILEEAFHDA